MTECNNVTFFVRGRRERDVRGGAEVAKGDGGTARRPGGVVQAFSGL